MSLVVGSEAVVAMHPDEAQEHALNIYIYIHIYQERADVQTQILRIGDVICTYLSNICAYIGDTCGSC